MERDRYHAIVSILQALPISSCPNLKSLSKQFSTSVDAIYSIYSQDVKTKVLLRGRDVKSTIAGLACDYLAGKDYQNINFIFILHQ